MKRYRSVRWLRIFWANWSININGRETFHNQEILFLTIRMTSPSCSTSDEEQWATISSAPLTMLNISWLSQSLCECVYFNETPELLNLFPHLHNTTSMELFLTWDTSSRLQRNGALASHKHYLWMTIRIMCSIYIHSIEYFIFYSLSIFMKMRNIKIVFMNGGCYITSFFNL